MIQIYLAQGFERFLLLTGYKGEQIEHFVADASWPSGAEIQCLATGEDTPTGGRLALAAGELGTRRFCATYADGVADVDLGALLAYHAEHGALATMTVVRPSCSSAWPSSTATALVRGFVEKPRSEHWINGGFFCFEPAVLELLAPTACSSASR